MTKRGRPRDRSIDDALLAAARHHLAQSGYDGLSIAAVAADAGTTRAALYRRWPTKADLATAAIADMSEAHARPASDDPFADLVAELEAFRRGISRPHGLALAATMLQEGTDPELVARYRERVAAPRRRRLGEILRRASPDADLELVVSTLTGSLYGYAVAGDRAPRDWAQRLARYTFAALETSSSRSTNTASFCSCHRNTTEPGS